MGASDVGWSDSEALVYYTKILVHGYFFEVKHTAPC